MTFDSPSYTIEKKAPQATERRHSLGPCCHLLLLRPPPCPGFPGGRNEADPRCLALKARLDQALRRPTARASATSCAAWPRSRPVFLPGGSGPPAAPPGGHPEAAIPFAGQANHWSAADQRRRMTLLDQCDLETVVQHTYTPGCMNRRNWYMVDRSSLLIAAYDGIPQGGTLNTLSYAMGKGVRTVILPVVSPANKRAARRFLTAGCCFIMGQIAGPYLSRLKILKISFVGVVPRRPCLAAALRPAALPVFFRGGGTGLLVHNGLIKAGGDDGDPQISSSRCRRRRRRR